MPAIDHESILALRLWTVLEAHGPFTTAVKEGNRIKLYGDKPTPIKLTWSQSPADFPEVTISCPGVADSLYTLAERYGMTRTFNPATRAVTCELTFGIAIDIVHRDTNFPVARALNAEVMTAIRLAGPTLGVTEFAVTRAGPATRSMRIVSGRFGDLGDAGGVPRLATSINLPVKVQAQTSDLLT
jgi:hypothetical protein